MYTEKLSRSTITNKTQPALYCYSANKIQYFIFLHTLNLTLQIKVLEILISNQNYR